MDSNQSNPMNNQSRLQVTKATDRMLYHEGYWDGRNNVPMRRNVCAYVRGYESGNSERNSKDNFDDPRR